RSRDAGSAVAYSCRNPGEGEDDSSGAGEGGDAPVGGGGGDVGLQQHQGCEGRDQEAAAQHGAAVEGKWAAVGVGGNASVRGLAGARDLSRRSVQEYCRGLAVGGAG